MREQSRHRSTTLAIQFKTALGLPTLPPHRLRLQVPIWERQHPGPGGASSLLLQMTAVLVRSPASHKDITLPVGRTRTQLV